MRSEMIYHEQEYDVIMIEREQLITEQEINQNILGIEHANLNYHCCFEVKEYRLFLRECEIVCANGYRAVLQETNQEVLDSEEHVIHSNSVLMIPNTYSGSVVIGRDLICTELEWQTYENKSSCYSYEEVIELIFSQGVLVTTINHSRAMKRVRMNLECGYRTLDKKKDVRCIQKFLRDSFVGDYKEQLL
ncbi:hypothetical protein [Anaerosporobacter sp.]|uniref:hypothetical protein n=1 Tax=Anaerosporobacter sp. TaxID=1872529 RepID=UPI00286F6B32|nr:hypothetical protein [Anaerosporobacter sp.]